LSRALTTGHALADIPFGIEHGIAEAHSDPTRFAIRAAVREIGWHLYCRGGADAMREALASAQLDDRFRDAVDRFWNGIGDWAA
jgi:hypothetical protein